MQETALKWALWYVQRRRACVPVTIVSLDMHRTRALNIELLLYKCAPFKSLQSHPTNNRELKRSFSILWSNSENVMWCNFFIVSVCFFLKVAPCCAWPPSRDVVHSVLCSVRARADSHKSTCINWSHSLPVGVFLNLVLFYRVKHTGTQPCAPLRGRGWQGMWESWSTGLSARVCVCVCVWACVCSSSGKKVLLLGCGSQWQCGGAGWESFRRAQGPWLKMDVMAVMTRSFSLDKLV